MSYSVFYNHNPIPSQLTSFYSQHIVKLYGNCFTFLRETSIANDNSIDTIFFSTILIINNLLKVYLRIRLKQESLTEDLRFLIKTLLKIKNKPLLMYFENVNTDFL